MIRNIPYFIKLTPTHTMTHKGKTFDVECTPARLSHDAFFLWCNSRNQLVGVNSNEMSRLIASGEATLEAADGSSAIDTRPFCEECGQPMTFEFFDGTPDNGADIYHCGDCDYRSWL